MNTEVKKLSKSTFRLVVLIILPSLIISCGKNEINKPDYQVISNPNHPKLGEWDFQLQKIWEIDSAGNNPLVEIIDVMADSEGKVFFFDRKYNKFFVFSSKGRFLYSFGKIGEGPGEYKMIFATHLVGDYVVATDLVKIHFFTKNGIHIKTHNMSSFRIPITFIDENRFITLPDDPYGIKKYNQLEVYDIITGKSTTIAKVLGEKPIIADVNGGKFSHKDPKYTTKTAVRIHNQSLYICNSDNYLFKKIDINGKELLSFSIPNRKREKLSDITKRKLIANLKFHGAKMPEELIKQLIQSMPDYSPYFHNISIDENGFIYVYLNNNTNLRNQEIDIFSPEGKYMYHSNITFSEKSIMIKKLLIKGNHLYLFVENDKGERRLINFKLNKPLRNI